MVCLNASNASSIWKAQGKRNTEIINFSAISYCINLHICVGVTRSRHYERSFTYSYSLHVSVRYTILRLNTCRIKTALNAMQCCSSYWRKVKICWSEDPEVERVCSEQQLTLYKRSILIVLDLCYTLSVQLSHYVTLSCRLFCVVLFDTHVNNYWLT